MESSLFTKFRRLYERHIEGSRLRYAKKLAPTWEDRLRYGVEFVLEASVSRYAFAAKFIRNKVVVDVGCGVGYGPAFLVKKDATMVVGGDISKVATLYGAKHFKENRLHFICFDAQKLPFPSNSFDVVTAFDLIEHLIEYELFLQECKRILKKGSVFICSTPNKEVTSPNSEKPLNPYHVKEFSANELYSLLHKVFEKVMVFGMDLQGKKDKIIYALFRDFEPRICSYSPSAHRCILRILMFLAKFILHQYRWIRIADIWKVDLDITLEKRHHPYELQVDSPPPQHIIAVCFVD